MTRILLLAGTAEARGLAEVLSSDPALHITASFSGATTTPAKFPCKTRTGGFGGPTGLTKWLQAEGTDLVIDATHPYATIMQANAVEAARALNLGRLRLMRASWPHRPSWITAPDLTAAANALPKGAKTLLTTGRKDITPFRARTDCRFTLRTIETVADLPDHITPLRARPPFRPDDERALFALLGISHLVTKNAGGTGTAKLDVADEMRLTTIVISRPTPPAGPILETVDATVAWVRDRVAY